jgi:outer membrane immunogenic protein
VGFNEENCTIAAASTRAGNSAFAADLALKAPAPFFYNWSGCYVRANGGGAWNSMTFTIGNNDPTFFGSAFASGATPSSYGESAHGGIVGAQAGCNWQPTATAYVVGLEIDADWANLKNTKSINTNVAGFASGTGTVTENMQSISTIRGRVGYAFDHLLVYATGGLALGNTNYYYSFAFSVSGENYINSYSATRIGGTAGGGLKYTFGNGFSAKIEGLWYQLEGAQFMAGGSTGAGPTTAAHVVTAGTDSGWMLRAGLNIKSGKFGIW